SPLRSNLDEELRKLAAAQASGADAVMDLSLGADQLRIRKAILARAEVMVGTVPLYQSAFELSAARRDVTEMTIADFLKTVRSQAEEGVDFMTIHCGVTRQALSAMERQGRTLDVVSRGGAMLVAWMRHNRKESPLYEHYDEILDILAALDVTLSLGDGMRPGAVADAGDRAQVSELLVLGELTERAWAKGVQVIVEGPGHVPLNQVADQMRLEKTLCAGAPFYILGPLVTDIAAGYDHIAGAIGGALAAMNGADFLCYVTPAEHLRLPTEADVVEGVIAARIAAHAADLAKGLPAAWERDRAMSRARKALDWEEQIALAIHPAKARAYREASAIGDQDVCTMCGEFCAIKRLQQF
ncbi:MAG TPA: phosphomethylpyrimidine synthase ThiC, partial [Desulfobacterales bacterium]|nr:phosphomethylpyrimidine synthase ThiC [Desulfobacterales bacterium]